MHTRNVWFVTRETVTGRPSVHVRHGSVTTIKPTWEPQVTGVTVSQRHTRTGPREESSLSFQVGTWKEFSVVPGPTFSVSLPF